MANNVFGFIGVENYEIILYLSRILNRLGKKVLLIDNSLSGDLAACIPIPNGLYPEDDLITYFGIEYTKKELTTELMDDFDDIIINYGFNVNDSVKYCNRIGYVTDQQKNNIEQLISIPKIDISDVSLLIKDMVDSKINEDYILDCLHKNIQKENIFVFEHDVIDKKCKLLTQYNSIYNFRRVTKGIKNYLKVTIMAMYPALKQKEFKTAYKIAERGR